MSKRIIVIGLVILATLVAIVLVRLVLLSVTAKPPATLGLTNGLLAPCPESPNCVASGGEGGAHAIAPLAIDLPQSAAVGDATRHAVEAIESMAGARVVTAENGYVHAEFTSRLFRFVDDLELLWNGEQRQFDVRSASRVGYSDLGVNRKRVEALRARLDN